MLATITIALTLLAVARAIPCCTRSTWTGSAFLFILCGAILCDRSGRLGMLDVAVFVAVFVAVVRMWPLIESSYHQHVMHNRKYGGLVFRNHSRHHANPTTKNGLMPIYHVLQLAAGYWIFRERPVISSVLSVVIMMLCVYELVHAGIHAGWAPQRLIEHHMHHHANPRENFTVTTTGY